MGQQRQYLILSLQSVPAKLGKKNFLSPGLLSTCLLLSVSALNPSPPSLDKVLRMARKFTSSAYLPASVSPVVWLARLDVEKLVGNGNDIQMSWAEARRVAQGNAEDLEKVWLWGVEEKTLEIPMENIYEVGSSIWCGLSMLTSFCLLAQELLQSSMRHASTTLHDKILVRYLEAFHPKMEPPSREQDLRRLFKTYRPSGAFYQHAFSCEAGFGGSVRGVLELLYERWRTGSDMAEAGLTWATWLLRDAGDGEVAGTVIRRTLGAVKDGEARDGLERRWTEILSGDGDVDVEADVIME